MPTDGKFSFCVLVDGVELPEYQKDGVTYIESSLWTPVSYKQRVRELAYGEIEEQEWPVTPYQIRVTVQPFCPDSWYHIYVDGVKVDWHVLGSGSHVHRSPWTSEGFRTSEGITEYLFALPRFARDETDRVATDRNTKIGTIEVERNVATFIREKYGDSHGITFNQANKKDAVAVTQGKHTMSTTKQGKVIRGLTAPGNRTEWSMGAELGRLSVQYHMGHTLTGMGIDVRTIAWRTAEPPPVKREKRRHHH